MDTRILLLVALIIYSVYSSPYNMDHLMKRSEKFCGERLHEMLKVVCKGNYYGPSKKNYPGILNYGEYEDRTDNDVDQQNELIFPFFQKEYVKSLIPRKARKSFGIVDECCYNSCSRKHLQLYCASDE